MPAEAIHLSALADTLDVAPGHVRRYLAAPGLGQAARTGAVMVDLPYFDRFHLALLRYVAARPQAPSPWGDILHQRAPIRLGTRLAEAGATLQRSAATAEAGAYLQALALGYFSHAALDTAIHPLVNRLAARRAAALGDVPARQHNEVEKFQSILFHQLRNGFDFMGTRALWRYIAVDFSTLVRPGPVRQAVRAAMAETLGEVPAEVELSGWARGYGQYVAVVSSPAGKLVAPPWAKERERAALFDEVDFVGRFGAAVGRSQRWVAALAAYMDDGTFDESARAALAREVPEQTMDPEPEPEPSGSPAGAGQLAD